MRYLLASSSLTRSGLQQWMVWQLTSSRLSSDSSSIFLMASGEAIRLSMMSCLCFLNLVKTQTGIMNAPKMLKKMKKLSMPSFPRFICAITGSFLYSAILYFLSISDFYSIYRCFSPGDFILCSIISQVTPIFRFISRILLSLLPSMGGSTSLSATSFTQDMLIFLMLFSQFSFSLLPISAFRSRACQWGGRLPNLVSLESSGCCGPSCCFSKSPFISCNQYLIGKTRADIIN